jgi:hypothetical protein
VSSQGLGEGALCSLSLRERAKGEGALFPLRHPTPNILAKKNFPESPRSTATGARNGPLRCIKTQHCSILQHPKKMGEPGFRPWPEEPRFALDVGKPPCLRASVGGGQISLNPVLIGDFVHVLLCLFALTGPSCLFRPRALRLSRAP